MTASPQHESRSPHAAASHGGSAPRAEAIRRIAVGLDGHPEGRDAVALGAAIARVTGAELLLVTVHSAPLVPMPPGLDWTSLREEAETTLRRVRDSVAPTARIVAETDLSIPRALHRVVVREHRNLLVLGSSRQATDGHVRIGKRTRQLLCHFECALAIAPRGMHAEREIRLERIGVGYDGGPESDAGLALGGSIACAAGAELHVRAVIDDRIPMLFRGGLGKLMNTSWNEFVAVEEQQLYEQALAAAEHTGATFDTEVLRGRPADALLALSEEVDLLVIGSRRWGPSARVLLGSTGEALMHDASCPLLAVPRPVS